MSQAFYISRNYTELGPFSPLEIAGFIKRGILRDGDHVRCHGKDEWVALEDWTPPAAPAGEKEPAKKPAPAKKAAKKTTAKKSIKKAAKKAASR